MSSSITRTKAARVLNEVADWLDAQPMRELLENLYGLVMSQRLTVIDGEIHIPELDSFYDLSKLINACRDKGVDVQEVIDKAVDLVWES